MQNTITIIRVRRGINGFKYSACDKNGYFIGNFHKLSDVRKHWKNGIKCGLVTLVRELDKQPDMAAIENAIKSVDRALKAFCEK